jgi:DNA-binding response OmpR family regulator
MEYASAAAAVVTQVPLPHILLVEDQERAARGMQELLIHEGFEVSCAPDGPTGLEATRRRRVDAVVLDVMLPGMDGFAVCRALRRHEATSHVPVIMLTGLSDTPSKLQSFELGADDYLVKPVPARELAARLRKLIAARVDVSKQVHGQRLQAIGEIAAAIGHEVNNPLAAALGTLDLVLLRHELSMDTRRDLAQCRTHLWRIASTVAQLTDVCDRTVEYLGPDRMIDLKPEGHA